MAVIVEQIDEQSNVVKDYDQILKPSEIADFFSEKFTMISQGSKSPLVINYKGLKVALVVKNISYLGHPHPLYKKRIQIPNSFPDVLEKYDHVLLLGIYRYYKNILLCNFDYRNYRNNSSNNSSAHVYSIDLLKATENGIFEKNDKNNNRIMCFRQENTYEVFDALLNISILNIHDEVEVFKEFNKTLEPMWYGLNCYEEMIESNFHNQYQSEWAGFYLEYLFEKFLDKNSSYKEICQTNNGKTKGHLDFDIYFPRKDYYGDLKSHSNGTGVQGNDKESVIKAVMEHKKVWYIVYSHDTLLDKECGFTVTRYWNEQLNLSGRKKNLYSYSKRMKNMITLTNMKILEINNSNCNYLSDYNQGKNSDGKSRMPKIKIEVKNEKNFIIYETNFPKTIYDVY